MRPQPATPGGTAKSVARSRIARPGNREAKLRTKTKIPEALRPTVRAALLLMIIFVGGTIGYAIIGGQKHSLLDAVYMTTITLTTVGYEEAIDLTGRPGAQIFTVLLLLTGTGRSSISFRTSPLSWWKGRSNGSFGGEEWHARSIG